MTVIGKLKTTELKLGDVVQVFDGAYGTATVKQIRDGMITFFRPYTQTADFSYTGGVICYIGFEEFTRFHSDDQEWIVYHRVELK